MLHNIVCVSLLLAIIILLQGGVAEGGWQVTFVDEFNAQTALNTSLWNTMYPFNAVINSELEYYASDAFTFSGTTLKIIGNKAAVVTDLGKFGYTSGLITTQHKFSHTYGYFEMSAKVPQGLGFWPAFWMLPEGSGGGQPQEIDIMEMVMNLPNDVYTTFHCNYSTGGSAGYDWKNTSFSTGFHTFSLQWLPKLLIWYVDGVQVFNFSSACVPNRPEYILANLAIGGGWPTPPDATTPFPSYLEIDYIRAYKYVATGGISIAGPGNGISYTPILDPASTWAVSNPKATPQNAAPGTTVTFSVVITMNSATAASNLNIQFGVHNMTASLTTLTTSGVNIPAGSSSSQTVTATYTIPTTQTTGYLRVALGIFSSSWSNVYWQENVFVVGVNKVVGKQ